MRRVANCYTPFTTYLLTAHSHGPASAKRDTRRGSRTLGRNIFLEFKRPQRASSYCSRLARTASVRRQPRRSADHSRQAETEATSCNSALSSRPLPRRFLRSRHEPRMQSLPAPAAAAAAAQLPASAVLLRDSVFVVV